MKKIFLAWVSIMALQIAGAQVQPLKIAKNKRYFVTADNKPFFWLGDTGWLLFTKLTREETIQYLDIRKQQGFNVIQVMVLHDVKRTVNVYGDSALHHYNVAEPVVTPGNSFADTAQYDFWDHVDFVIDEAAKRGIYMALVPVWGTNVKEGFVTVDEARKYAAFLADRFRNKPNIIWVNGGDIKGSDGEKVWNAIGETIKQIDHKHLMTFHPRGRSSSSQWFQTASWLDFNMFQSGHKDYAQDTALPRIGEDNYKFVLNDYALQPAKPTLDGEPSYENIPHGLHDTAAVKWNCNDVRRYAYWSLLSGACGFTYGHNAVMQFHNGVGAGAYGSRQNWKQALTDPGAEQMQIAKRLMLSKPYQQMIIGDDMIIDQGDKYDHVAVAKGKTFAFIYTYNGREIKIRMGMIVGEKIHYSWYNPRNGSYSLMQEILNNGVRTFDPPGDKKEGNDWVLVLETSTK